MKRSFFLIAFVVSSVMAAVGARADVLHWGLYNPTVTYTDGTSDPLAALQVSEAKVGVYDKETIATVTDFSKRVAKDYLEIQIPVVMDDGSVTFIPTGTASADVVNGVADDFWVDYASYASLDDPDSWLFAISVYSDDGTFVAMSDALSYEDLKAWNAESEYWNPDVGPWSPNLYSSVPEPTGGLLVLVGLSLLGLKRKQEEVA